MKIQRIRLKNFKSFYTETEIDFESLKGLYRVSGQIGSGKTTIGEAIIYGLYGKVADKNNGSLISWGQKKALVELWCQSRGKNLYIRREINAYGQSPMSVEVDGEPIIFTDKRSAQDQLEQEYLDAPRTSMELLCIISFNNFKSLSTLNTKDTKQFLDNVLGFDALTKYIDATKQEQSELRQSLVQSQSDIRAIQSQIDRIESYVFVEGDISTIQTEITKLKSEMEVRKKQAIEELTQPSTDLKNAQLKQMEIMALGKNKKKEIDFIKQGKCPTCGAPIDSSQLATKEQERVILIEQYESYASRIRDLQAIITQINTELKTYIDSMQTLVKSHESEIIRLNEQSKMTRLNQDEIKKLKKQIKKLEKQSTQISTDLSEYDQLATIFSTQIRQHVLESFIPTINNRISEIAGMLNMKFVPQFDSMFKCSVQMGTELVPTSALSTGQLKMVDMIIILAVLGSVISKIQSNVIVLDELFANLDPRTRAELVSVLRTTLPESSSILIVSHQDMDTEMFDGHIKMRLIRNEQGAEETQMTIN